MDTYILQKDWIMPHTSMEHSTIIKAGTELTADGPNRMYKLPQGYSFNYKVVENTPEWFLKKERNIFSEELLKQIRAKGCFMQGQHKLMPNLFFDQIPAVKSVLGTGKEITNSPGFEESTKSYVSKPALGIIPEFIWKEYRVKELQQEMLKNGFQNCEEWIKEWNEHVNWLMNAKKPGASK